MYTTLCLANKIADGQERFWSGGLRTRGKWSPGRCREWFCSERTDITGVALTEKRPSNITSVSYTHLDVYKRQTKFH